MPSYRAKFGPKEVVTRVCDVSRLLVDTSGGPSFDPSARVDISWWPNAGIFAEAGDPDTDVPPAPPEEGELNWTVTSVSSVTWDYEVVSDWTTNPQFTSPSAYRPTWLNMTADTNIDAEAALFTDGEPYTRDGNLDYQIGVDGGFSFPGLLIGGPHDIGFAWSPPVIHYENWDGDGPLPNGPYVHAALGDSFWTDYDPIGFQLQLGFKLTEVYVNSCTITYTRRPISLSTGGGPYLGMRR